ncbi:MAG: hypothetical protein NBV77_00465 [Bacteroidia bacterium]|jgi:hypothetical protein|nr:hypothetical protein [Bacteroidia bacterium]
MRKYVIENTLGTTTQQRTVAAIISLIISLIITAGMYLLHIRVPNPPFENKTGELMLDFGLEEVSLGSPNEGGPSDFPPELGGGASEPSTTTSTPNAVQTGGYGDIVNTADQSVETGLPPIDPPASKTPQVNSRLAGLQSKIGKRGTEGNGSPKGVEGGQGNVGFGGGANTGGILGNGGTRVTKNTGNGFFTASGFANYSVNSNVRELKEKLRGTIDAEVTVDCNGNARLKRLLPSSNFQGLDTDAKQAMEYFISKTTFTRVGDKCPETGRISLNVKNTISN